VGGPNLAGIAEPLSGLTPLPGAAFELSGRLEGDAVRFAVPSFSARLGPNDLAGTFTVNLENRPFVDADLRSSHLGVPERAPEASEETTSKEPRLVFSDEPLGLEALESLDARIRWTAVEVAIPGLPLRDVAVEGTLEGGTLRLDRIEGTGRNGGHARAGLSISPVAGGYRLHAEGTLAGGRVDLSKTKEGLEQAPSLDVEFEIEGTGPSLHGIAASANGGALFTLGPGRIPSNISDFVTSGVLRGLLDAMNPFRKSSPYTTVECAVAAAGIEGGKATVEPIAARGDKLTIVGRGSVDFDTERIELVWTLKPRRGVGISASSIANPYIKLGGTLSAPSIDAKPLHAAASTGAAVATAGLTVLFKGLYDRITAEKKVCIRALEKAEEQAEARESRANEEER